MRRVSARFGRSTAAVTGVALALLLSGCAGEAGTPKPDAGAPSGVSTSPGSTSSTPTSSGGTDSGLAKVDPCGLMTASEAGQLGITGAGKKDSLAGDPTCDWKLSGSFGVLLVLSPTQGVKDLNLNGQTPTPLPLTKHKASKLGDSLSVPGDAGACTVLIEVSSSSSASVEVSNVGSTGTELACQRAEQVAKFVDPRLP